MVASSFRFSITRALVPSRVASSTSTAGEPGADW